MKYIRTKDGIYSRGKIICYAFRQDYQSEDWDKDIESYLQTPILKQANTIEELCDRFVIEFKHGEKQSSVYRDDFHTLEEVYEFVNEYSGRCIIVSIKGLICTDKGLIYVAKMNEKGELELL